MRNTGVREFDREEHAIAKRDHEQWLLDQRSDEETDSAATSDQGDAFGALLTYLADGYENGTMAVRAAALVRVIRLSLLGEATDKEIAAKLGTSYSVFQHVVQQFRECVPALARANRSNVGGSQESVFQSRSQLRKKAREIQALKMTNREEREKCRHRISLKLASMREVDLERRARDAAATIKEAKPIVAEIQARWADLNLEVTKRCAIPDPTPDSEAQGLDAFERVRASILGRRRVA